METWGSKATRPSTTAVSLELPVGLERLSNSMDLIRSALQDIQLWKDRDLTTPTSKDNHHKKKSSRDGARWQALEHQQHRLALQQQQQQQQQSEEDEVVECDKDEDDDDDEPKKEEPTSEAHSTILMTADQGWMRMIQTLNSLAFVTAIASTFLCHEHWRTPTLVLRVATHPNHSVTTITTTTPLLATTATPTTPQYEESVEHEMDSIQQKDKEKNLAETVATTTTTTTTQSEEMVQQHTQNTNQQEEEENHPNEQQASSNKDLLSSSSSSIPPPTQSTTTITTTTRTIHLQHKTTTKNKKNKNKNGQKTGTEQEQEPPVVVQHKCWLIGTHVYDTCFVTERNSILQQVRHLHDTMAPNDKEAHENTKSSNSDQTKEEDVEQAMDGKSNLQSLMDQVHRQWTASNHAFLENGDKNHQTAQLSPRHPWYSLCQKRMEDTNGPVQTASDTGNHNNNSQDSTPKRPVGARRNNNLQQLDEWATKYHLDAQLLGGIALPVQTKNNNNNNKHQNNPQERQSAQERDDKRHQAEFRRSIKDLRRRVLYLVKQRFSDCELSVYGSCLTQLTSSSTTNTNNSTTMSSDVDLSLHLPQLQALQQAFERGDCPASRYDKERKSMVYQVCRKLERYGDFVNLTPVPHARVPVIKGTWTDARNPYTMTTTTNNNNNSNNKDNKNQQQRNRHNQKGTKNGGTNGTTGPADAAPAFPGSIDFDICLCNDIAVVNSSLIREYCAMDPRIPVLCKCVKQWAKACGIASAANNTWSSYTWTNLVLIYLQHVQFVPNLQSPWLIQQVILNEKSDKDDKASGTNEDKQTNDARSNVGKEKNRWHSINNLNTFFLTSDQAETVWKRPGPWTDQVTVTALLFGFFEFYALGLFQTPHDSEHDKDGTMEVPEKQETTKRSTRPFPLFVIGLRRTPTTMGRGMDKDPTLSSSLEGLMMIPKTVFRHCKWSGWAIEDPFETYDSHCPHNLGDHADAKGMDRIQYCLEQQYLYLQSLLESWFQRVATEKSSRNPKQNTVNSETTWMWTESSVQSKNTNTKTREKDRGERSRKSNGASQEPNQHKDPHGTTSKRTDQVQDSLPAGHSNQQHNKQQDSRTSTDQPSKHPQPSEPASSQGRPGRGRGGDKRGRGASGRFRGDWGRGRGGGGGRRLPHKNKKKPKEDPGRNTVDPESSTT